MIWHVWWLALAGLAMIVASVAGWWPVPWWWGLLALLLPFVVTGWVWYDAALTGGR